MARENFTHKNKKEDNGPNVCSLKFAQWGSCCLITKLADAIFFVCIRNNSDDHKKVRQRLILNITFWRWRILAGWWWWKWLSLIVIGISSRWRVLVLLAGGEFWSDLIWSSVIYQRDLDLAWLTNILQSSITTITTRLSGQDLWDTKMIRTLHYILLTYIYHSQTENSIH